MVVSPLLTSKLSLNLPHTFGERIGTTSRDTPPFPGLA